MKYSAYLNFLSYLQVIGDEQRTSGFFVLTGSGQFGLSSTVTQSLAGRIPLLCLLSFSLTERRKTEASNAINDVLCSGFYPSIHDQKLNPQEVMSGYFATYVATRYCAYRERWRTFTVRNFRASLCWARGTTHQFLQVGCGRWCFATHDKTMIFGSGTE